jgi:subfamily B ATP-binding cassette protein HlyB/CyaB
MESSGEGDAQPTGLDAFVLLLRFHEIAVDPAQIRHQYGSSFGTSEMLRCAKAFKLKARAIVTTWPWLATTPLPALAECGDGNAKCSGWEN